MSIRESDGDLGAPVRTGRSPVIRALRSATDEVQLGSVLEAVCQEPAVAQALASAVINNSSDGNVAARRQVKRKAGAITCMGEQRLEVRVSRQLARSRAAGRVDLRFVGDRDWKLGVELKLEAAFGHKQLQRYAAWGPVVAVVRRSAQVKDLDQLKADPHWVGVATWRSLLPELRDLPVSDAWRHDWHAFLDVVEDDGDFDEVQPKPREVQDQLKLMAELSPRIFDHFSMRIDELYGTGSAAAISLKAYKARGSRTWTSFGISASDGPWMWMGIRNLYSRAPRVWVDYYPLRDWRAKRRLEKPHLKLRRAGFELREGDYRYDKPHDELADVSLAAPEAVLDAFNGRLDALVRARVFDVELDRLRR